MPEIFNYSDLNLKENFPRIKRILLNGGIGIIPVDTVFGLIGKAFDDATFKKLKSIKPNRRAPFSVIFQSLESFLEYYGGIDPVRKKVFYRLWYGPVTTVLPYNENIPTGFGYRTSGIGIRIASDNQTRDFCGSVGIPIWATSCNYSSEEVPVTFSQLNKNIVSQADFVITSDKTDYTQESTVIDLKNFPFSVLREGAWIQQIRRVLRQSQEVFNILIVCTGNICRSPIAERLLSLELLDSIQFPIRVTSAGIAAINGNSATPEMVKIAQKWGIDLNDHEARQIDQDVLESQDFILTMSNMQQEYILNMSREYRKKIHFFGESIDRTLIPDPYGLSKEDYFESAKLIKKAAKAWGKFFKSLFVDR